MCLSVKTKPHLHHVVPIDLANGCGCGSMPTLLSLKALRYPILCVCAAQRGGALVVRRLCGVLGAQPVFVELAAALNEEKDLVFAAGMVQVRGSQEGSDWWEQGSSNRRG